MSTEGTWVRVCPDCDAEFVSTVETCFDCGTPLETRLADADADPVAASLAPAAPADATAPPEGWVPIETADLDWALELRQRLGAAGISSRLAQDCKSCKPTLSVYVAPDRLDGAQRVAQDLYVEKVPEAGGDLGVREAERCPACGARLPAVADSCPDCGLAFVAVEGADGEGSEAGGAG